MQNFTCGGCFREFINILPLNTWEIKETQENPCCAAALVTSIQLFHSKSITVTKRSIPN